ncbi:Endo-1,4-beta-xylanase Z precursor [Chlamydia abortus]|uniref:Alpha/beta hydrolase n=1 Tax=Paenibacillus residui TaxID=629724 RepID=A0ABW3D9A4_9BACL|nr:MULTISPECIES: alpha/beta hydrolase family protein [Paenibacillaceae]SHE10013.1 Endo-1,4-beta-xylanase Z precursor [Chlamydia abortus]
MIPTPVTFHSQALNRRLTFYVFLPPGYEQSEKRYPVIYLLHGRFDSEISWPYRGNAYATAERMMASGELTESIIIMPSDGGFSTGTYYLDWHDGSGNFEQYFMNDLIPFIDSQYRTLTSRENRVICGLSMGGFGSLLLALRNPGQFGAAGSLSGALGMFPSSDRLDLAPDWEPDQLVRIVGPLDEEYARHHNLSFLAARALQQGPYPEIYFDCGTEDFLYQANLWLKDELTRLNYPFTYQEFSGSHTWEYWSEHLEDVLKFMNAYLSRSR